MLPRSSLTDDISEMSRKVVGDEEFVDHFGDEEFVDHL